MHRSIQNWFRRVAQPMEFMGARVLDVGAMNQSGSLRNMIEDEFECAHYEAIDIKNGPGVDELQDVTEADAVYGASSFDAIICTETLQHIPDWRAAVAAMKTLLQPGGVIYLTTRSEGAPGRGLPADYWRFSSDQIKAMFRDHLILNVTDDESEPGVFLKARKAVAARAAVDLDAIEPGSIYAVK